MEPGRNRRVLVIGIAVIAVGVFMVLRGAMSDSASYIVAGGIELVLGAAFVVASRAFGGSRSAAVRPSGRERSAAPDFTILLRGYEPARVDELIRRGQDALVSGPAARREQVRAELDSERAALPIALRGYDRSQVDAYLMELSAALAQQSDESEAAWPPRE